MTQEHIAGLALTLISILLLFFPNQIWKITESWKNRETTAPSKGYKVITRCVGAVFVIVGLIVFFML